MVCLAKCPCCVVDRCIDVSRFIWIGHVYFRGAHHRSEDLMDALTNGIRFWIFNRGWLTLYAWIAPTRCRISNSDISGIYTTRFCYLIDWFDQITYRRFLLRLSSLYRWPFWSSLLWLLVFPWFRASWKRGRSWWEPKSLLKSRLCLWGYMDRIGWHIEPPKECILLFRWKMSIL